MPKMGEPTSVSRNNFSNIGMKRDASAGDQLNQLAGNNEVQGGVKYVDSKKHNKMGKDEFLKLLTVQLQNQDPLKPVDQKKFAADLAQFSQLEQLANMNTKLDSMNENVPVESKFYGASFLGKLVTTSGSTIIHDGKVGAKPISFDLPKKATKVIVRVIDEKGQNLANIQSNKGSKGLNNLEWDGKKMDGQLANSGQYSFKVFAWDESGESFSGETKSNGLVQGVRFSGGKAMLKLDSGKEIFLHDVEKFEIPKDNKKI